MTSPIGGLESLVNGGGLSGLLNGLSGGGLSSGGADTSGLGGITRPAPPTPPSPAGTAPETSGPTFADGLRAVEGLQAQTEAAATGLATGTITDVHAYTVAAAKSSLAVELTTALRNRAVEAYQEIMRMQV